MPGDGLKKQRGVLHRVRHGANLVERRGVGGQAVARDQAVGGFQAHYPAQSGRLTDRPTRVGTKRERHFTRPSTASFRAKHDFTSSTEVIFPDSSISASRMAGR